MVEKETRASAEDRHENRRQQAVEDQKEIAEKLKVGCIQRHADGLDQIELKWNVNIDEQDQYDEDGDHLPSDRQRGDASPANISRTATQPIEAAQDDEVRRDGVEKVDAVRSYFAVPRMFVHRIDAELVIEPLCEHDEVENEKIVDGESTKVEGT